MLKIFSKNQKFFAGFSVEGCVEEEICPLVLIRSAPGDGILCSVYARSEGSRLTDRQSYRMSDKANWEEALACASIAVPDC